MDEEERVRADSVEAAHRACCQIATDQRLTLTKALRLRNLREVAPFDTLIGDHSRSFEHVESLKRKTVAIQIENERMRKDLLNSQVSGGSGEGGGGIVSERISELEKRLYETQKDLTTALTGKDINSQKILELNENIRNMEAELAAKNNKIAELENELRESLKQIAALQTSKENLLELQQTAADEYAALALNCSQLEDRLLKSENENKSLVRQIIKFKQLYSDHLNSQNDAISAERGKKLQEEIAEASREMGRRTTTMNLPASTAGPMRSPTVVLASQIPDSVRQTVEGHEDEVTCLKFFSNCQFITAGMDRKVKIWDSNSASVNLLQTLSGSNAGVTSVDLDFQENYLIASSYDYASRIWSLRDHRLKHSLTGHSGKVMAARFIGDDSTRVVTGSYDRTIKTWDLRQLACVRVVHCHSSCSDLVVDNNVMVSGHIDKRLRFWDTRSKSDQSTNEILLSGKVTSVHASQDGQDVLACTRDGALKVIDVRKNQVKATLVSDSLKIGADYCRATISPAGRYAMAGSSDGGVVIFDISSQKVEKVLKGGHSGSMVLATAWAPDGRMLLSADKGKRVVLWG